MPSLFLSAVDNVGQKVSQFFKPIQIIYNYTSADLTNIKEDTLKLFSYNENLRQWEVLSSIIDQGKKTVTADTSHFSHFALMGEVKDKIAPITSVAIHGDKGQDNWYRSKVTVDLSGKDNIGGIGLQDTIYSINNSDWNEYSNPLNLDKEGVYTIKYLSIDKWENKEEQKTITFRIDKTPPEANIFYDLSKFDISVNGKDSSSAASVTINKTALLHPKFTIIDLAGNTLVINTDEIKLGKQVTLSIKNIQYNINPTVNLDQNIFFTLVATDKNNKVSQLDQYYSLKDDKKILTSYSLATNITKIYTRTPRSTLYTIETKPGINLLQLIIQNGTLKYAY
jgi:hypothetical protein